MPKVVIKSGAYDLSATLIMPSTGMAVAAVVLLHGMTSSEASYVPLAELLAQHGIAGLAVTLRGHGASQGDFATCTVEEALADGIAAYDFITNQPSVDVTRIGMVGSSVGAILAAMSSLERDVKSLVLRAPAAYTSEMLHLTMADTMTSETRQFHEIDDLAQTPAGQAITSFDGSLLVIASGADTTIPAKITNGYVDIAAHAITKQVIVLQGAPHNLSGTPWKDECNRLACDWLVKTL